jgi:hypothetical protein
MQHKCYAAIYIRSENMEGCQGLAISGLCGARLWESPSKDGLQDELGIALATLLGQQAYGCFDPDRDFLRLRD